MKLPELLAPAGDFAAVDAALLHGADAIYAGIGQFNLRAHAPNFTKEDIPELVDRIHSQGKRIYFTLNTMPTSVILAKIKQFLESIEPAEFHPDAFIVSDPGVIDLCHEILPEVPLHLSTQTGTFNSGALRFWQKQGISRAVLPREFTLREIAEISLLDIMETEIFIHGAMCVSISGRCLMGAYLSERHPNRGDCSQPCRWKYRLTEVTNAGQVAPSSPQLDAEEQEDGTYLLNSRDLNSISLLPEIVASGVASLKIEGRNKSVHYVGAVVKAYRAALDSLLNNPQPFTVAPEWNALLESVEHRPYTTGFYNGEYMLQEVFTSKASAPTRIIGMVKALLPGGVPVIDIKNSFATDEELEVVPVNQFRMPYPVIFTRFSDLSNNPVNRPPSNRLLLAHGVENLQIGDMLRKKI